MDRLNRLARTLSHAAVFLFVAGAVAIGAVTSFNNGASGSSVRALLNRLLAMQYNVLDYGATCNNVADDTTGIQSAINTAISDGGGTVYFPVGTCKTSAALTFVPVSTGNQYIRLQGATRSDRLAGKGSYIVGNFAGYIIDRDGSGTGATLYSVRDLGISNSHASGSGIRMAGLVTGEIADCNVAAKVVGIDIGETNTYNVEIRNTSVIGGGVGTGVIMTQSALRQSSITGWATGVVVSNTGSVIEGNRFEVNSTSVIIGQDGTGASVSAVGVLLAGSSFEQNDTPIYVRNGSGVNIQSNAITGTVGTVAAVAGLTATWSGGVATVTKTSHGLTTGNGVRILGATPSGYNSLTNYVTVLDANTFTYPLVADPGGAMTVGSFQLSPLYGIRVAGTHAINIVGNSIATQAAIGGIDVSANSSDAVVIAGNTINTGTYPNYVLATGGSPKQTFINNSPQPNIAMLFANLPASPIEGMEFDITDGTNGLSWGTVATNTGTHTTHYHVRYNGSNWTVMGQ